MQRLLPLALLLLAAGDVLAQDDFASLERTTQRKVRERLWALANEAARSGNAFVAREELRLALEVQPTAARAKRRLLELATRGGAAHLGERFAARQQQVHEAIGLELTTLVLRAKADRLRAPYTKYKRLVVRRFRSAEAMKRLGLVYFKAYLKWVPRKVYRRLKSGWEKHKGKWLDPDTVRGLDLSHTTMTNPWILTSKGFRLRTNLNLRAAKRFLAYAEAYRRWFLDRFSPSWDLRPPAEGKLPLVVTRKHEEFRAEMQKALKRKLPFNAMPDGVYLRTDKPLCPCLISLEPYKKYSDKRTDIRKTIPILTHELTHQLAFEYSRHSAPRRVRVNKRGCYWLIEGFATFLGCHTFAAGVWTLKDVRLLAYFLSYCARRRLQLPKLVDFIDMDQKEFQEQNRTQNYRMSGAAVCFMYYGARGKYRQRLLKLLEMVHMGKATPSSFSEVFRGVDRAVLQADWLAYLGRKSIPIGNGKVLRLRERNQPKAPYGSGSPR